MKRKSKRERLMDYVRYVSHLEYDEESYKFHYHERYIKETNKKFRNKRDRLKAKRELKSYIKEDINE